jgi:AcrR family transcriptional regulator
MPGRTHSEANGRQNNRREHLLAEAAHLFARRGFEATSMRDIAAAVSMLPGSLYYHFPSKEELFVAVHQAGVANITRAVEQAIAGRRNSWDRLEAACAAHLEALLGRRDFAAIVTPNFPPKLNRLRARLIAQRDAYEQTFRRLIGELDLPRGVDRRLLRLHLLGALNWAQTWYRPGRRRPAAIARGFVRMLRQQLEPEAR